jgi:predicted dehydrogenase
MATARDRIGIVGFGRMVEVCHLDGLRRAGWNVAAVLDITESRRRRALDSGIPLVTADLGEFLDQGLRAALIATHSSVRSEVAVPMAQRGIHLLVEKPLAMTGDEAEAICEACERHGVMLSVYHNRRWDPDFVLVRRLVESGFLGEVFHVENRTFEPGPAVAFGAEDFRQTWRITAEEGGGTLLDFGPHWLDQVLTLMHAAGPVVSVMGDVRHIRHGDADDHFMINLVFESAARAIIGKSDVCPTGPRIKWVLIGTRGSAWCSDGRLVAKDVHGVEQVFDQPDPPADLHRNFLHAVRGEEPLLVTGRQSLRSCRIIDAARESSGLWNSVEVRI